MTYLRFEERKQTFQAGEASSLAGMGILKRHPPRRRLYIARAPQAQ